MTGTRQHTGPEPWEALAWQVYEAIEAARRQQGKAAAAQLASKALEAIAPAQSGRGDDLEKQVD